MKAPQILPPAIAATLLAASGAYSAELSVDTTFSDLPNGAVVHSILPVEGAVYVAGDFNPQVIKLLPNGAVDSEFSLGSGFDGPVFSLALNGAGELMTAGSFNTLDQASCPNIAKLLTGGSLDTLFDLGAGPSSRVQCIAYTPDGKVYAAGPFRRFNGSPVPYVVRLDELGNLDETFQPAIQPSFAIEAGVQSMALQPDGKLLLGGIFMSTRGFEYLVRLNPDGSLDETFTQNHGPILYVKALLPLDDGKVLVAGLANADDQGFLRRLNSDGTVDTSFQAPTFNSYVNAIALSPNGEIFAGGTFTEVGGEARNRLVCLNADGALDSAWRLDADGPVTALACADEDVLFAGGAFTEIGGVARNGFAKVVEKSPTVTALSSNTFFAWIKAEPGQEYEIEASEDLQHWIPFGRAQATALGVAVADPAALGKKVRFFRARLIE